MGAKLSIRAIVILLVVNLPVYFLIARKLFDSWTEALLALSDNRTRIGPIVIETPDWNPDVRRARGKLGIFLVLAIGLLAWEYGFLSGSLPAVFRVLAGQ